jgi:hypothetical protein
MHPPDYPTDEEITDGVRIVSYSVSQNGEFELVPGTGWKPMNVANRQAWIEIEKKIIESTKKVKAGRVSCLHYYMTANQMDIALLAQYTRQSRWRVRMHFIPFIFKRLCPERLNKYAALFQVSKEDLENCRLKAPVYDHG